MSSGWVPSHGVRRLGCIVLLALVFVCVSYDDYERL